MQFSRHTLNSRDNLMNCFPTEAFLVVTEASQTLDTNIGHIKWNLQGLTAADKHFQIALIFHPQTFDHSHLHLCFKTLQLLVPPTIACPSVTNLDTSYFSSFQVCVCAGGGCLRSTGVHMCGYMHRLLHKCAHVQSPKSSAIALHLIRLVRVSYLNPELSDTANLG